MFLHWADRETPDQIHPVNLVIDFQADGQAVSEMRKGKVSGPYRIEGDMIIYHGKRGEEKWKLVSFVPGESMVVNNSGAIMTFERK